MRYDSETDRWNVSIDDEDYEMHCGNGFEIYIGGQPIPCRIEKDNEWYVIMKDVSFTLRKRTTYMVNV